MRNVDAGVVVELLCGRLDRERLGDEDLLLARYPADWLRDRMRELRNHLTAHDATYVALAEMTGATELLTTDGRLARAAGVACPVTVLP